MSLQTTALDRMFEQVTAKRRGRKDPRLPHGRAPRVGGGQSSIFSAPKRNPRDVRIARLSGR